MLFFKETSQHIETHVNEVLWKGLKLKLIDGTTLSMPDTLENESVFPQPQSQQEEIGFPLLRLCALISLASGVVLDYKISPFQGKGAGETTLFHQMIKDLQPNDLILGDRLYGNYSVAARLIQQNMKFLFRANSNRKIIYEHGIQLGKQDHKVFWYKPQRFKGMDKDFYDALPARLQLREFELDGITYITNLLEPKEFKKKELSKLYKLRWHVELDLRNIKQTMKLDILSCKSPSMIRKEINVRLMAYNLICLIMVKSSLKHIVLRRALSFTTGRNAINLFLGFLNYQSDITESTFAKAYDSMLIQITSRMVGNRPGRREPRVVKRRPKPFSLLMESRKKARERLIYP